MVKDRIQLDSGQSWHLLRAGDTQEQILIMLLVGYKFVLPSLVSMTVNTTETHIAIMNM